jgi:peroxiredoxin Q/BCP
MRQTWMISLLLTILLTLGMAAVLAEEEASELKVGDKAPLFESIDDRGQTWKASEYVGKNILVIYFFPAAMTGG